MIIEFEKLSGQRVGVNPDNVTLIYDLEDDITQVEIYMTETDSYVTVAGTFDEVMEKLNKGLGSGKKV